jgi:hypothetical protein
VCKKLGVREKKKEEKKKERTKKFLDFEVGSKVFILYYNFKVR